MTNEQIRTYICIMAASAHELRTLAGEEALTPVQAARAQWRALDSLEAAARMARSATYARLDDRETEHLVRRTAAVLTTDHLAAGVYADGIPFPAGSVVYAAKLGRAIATIRDFANLPPTT
jgi:hypothetical protein